MSDADPDFVAWLKGAPDTAKATPWSRMESAWNAGVAHERARLLPQIDAAEANLADCIENHLKADLGAAEARGAALAVEQCRRLAEELKASGPTDRLTIEDEMRRGGPTEWDSWDRALDALISSLPATPDLAAEVRRIEERELERLADRIAALPCECDQSIERWGGHAKAELRRQLAQGEHYDSTCPRSLAARMRAGEFNQIADLTGGGSAE